MTSESFPKGLRGIAAKGLKTGNIVVKLVYNGRSLAGIETSARDAGGIAATVLAAATQASEASGRGPLNEDHFQNLPVLRVSTVGISENPKPNHYTLHIQIGEAQIGFELTPPMLRPLGQALLAASAPMTTQQ